MTRSTTLALLSAFALVACSKKTPEPAEEKPATPPAASAPTLSSASPSAESGSIAYIVPSAWHNAPNPNAMRKATFLVPRSGSDPEDGELSVSTAGGGIDANIDRWAKQFGGATPAKEERTSNGLKVTVVQLNGTYTAGGMMGAAKPPKPHWALLGAVVDTGATLYFFKLTGPEATVTAAKKDFDTFVTTFKKT